MIHPLPFSKLHIIAIVLLLALAGPVSAATSIWDAGGGSTAWGTNNNWNPNGAPSGNNVILRGGLAYLPSNQNIAGLSIRCLTFDSSTTTAFTVSGNSITLTDGGGNTGPTLTIASGAAGHTISSNIILNSATRAWQQDSSNAFTVSGVIDDGVNTYGITKTGTGTLIFSGTDTYGGTTTVSAGTLSLGDGTKTGNIIPAANLITDNAALIYNTPSTITHSGVISGTGTFTKSGTGMLTLSGTDTYGGVTTVSAGTLSLGNGVTAGNIIPAANLITDDAALIYNTPSTITHSGVISGTGTFTKSGTGILTLSGTDTYGGTTTVSAGTLSLGDGTKTGNIIPAANLITDNAALIYNTPSTITHSGVISGTGTFTKSGTGTLTLSGNNLYSGTTTVSGGRLQLGDGTTTGNIIPAANLITDTAAVTYNTPSTITHSGVISGAGGSFTKTGTGTLILSGANSYTGATTVSAGELQFNGINTGTSAKTVSSGGTLAGSGTIRGAVTVNTGSTLRGGTGSGSAGTLTITSGTGTLTFSGLSSSLDVTSDGTSLSRVSAGTNTITEGSGMTVNLLDPMPTGTYTLISKTSAGLPATLPTLGTNNSGKTAVFAWVSGTGLIVTLYPVPVVTGVSPNTGNIAGGDSVTITGSGFYGGGSSSAVTAVHFGTTAATTYTVTSDTSITVTSPAHAAGTVDVTVTTPYGTSAISSADQFTYVAVSVSITLNENSIALPLAADSSATDSSLVITATTSVPFTITVADSSGRSTNQGYMGSYTGTTYDSGGPVLGSPLQLAGTTTGTTTAQSITGPITSAALTLYSGSAAVTNQNLPTLFTQPVAWSDPHLTGGSTYRIDLVFTIAAT